MELNKLNTGVYPNEELQEIETYLKQNRMYHPDNTLPIGLSVEQKKVHIASVSKYRTELQKYDELVLKLNQEQQDENNDTVSRMSEVTALKTEFTTEILALVEVEIEQLKLRCSEKMIASPLFDAWLESQKQAKLTAYWIS